MKFEELKKLLQYNVQESKVFMPNEIFEDLKGTIKNSPHIAFAYSYYYLISWLYRYTKYGRFHLDNSQIKEILGYTKITKGLEYIIKKNGLLDEIGYTVTTKDFPISWIFEDNLLEFDLLSDCDEDTQKIIKKQLSRKYTIKFPVKAFFRHMDDEEMKEEYDKCYQDGTFYEFENTHCIPFEVFLYCMSNDNIGCTGFYLYSYIKRKNDKYLDGWDVSINNMVTKTGIAEKTLLRYLDQLRKYRMVQVIHNQEYFCKALKEDERKANTYIINDFDYFSDKPQFYERMKVVTTKQYYKMKEEEFEKLLGNSEVDIPLDELPY